MMKAHSWVGAFHSFCIRQGCREREVHGIGVGKDEILRGKDGKCLRQRPPSQGQNSSTFRGI